MLLACVGAVSRATAAEEPKPAADELISRGLQLRAQGKTTEALDVFRQAHALAPSPRTFGQMGLAEASLHAWMDADSHLGTALARPNDPWIVKNLAILEHALAVSGSHIGEIEVVGLVGARVHVGGTEGPWPVLPLQAPLRAAEGDVRVVAIAAGYKQLIQHVRITGGTRTKVTLKFVPEN
jgi:hypothetical protein